MANRFDLNPHCGLFLPVFTSAATKTGHALDSAAMVFGVSGDSIAFRFTAPVTSNLIDFFFFQSATATGIGETLTCELRNYSSATVPGSTVHASQTVAAPTTANKWVKCTFASPFQCVRGTTYYIIIYNSNATPTVNFPTIVYQGIVADSAQITSLTRSYTTTDGWATGTARSANCAMFVKFADGTILAGSPFTLGAAYTSNQLERGIRITGLTGPIVLCGIQLAASTLVNKIRVYSGSTVPGTGDILDFTPAAEAMAAYFFTPVTLQAGTNYRIVVDVSGDSVAPSYFQIEDSAAFAEIISTGVGGGTMYSTIDNGAGGWTDETDKYPRMGLLFQDLVPRGVIGRPNMMGGMAA